MKNTGIQRWKRLRFPQRTRQVPAEGEGAMLLEYSLVGALLVMGGWPSGAVAQDHQTHTVTPQHREQTPEHKTQANAAVRPYEEN